MDRYKVGYGLEEYIEVSAIDHTSAIIEAFKIKFPKSLGFGIGVTKVEEGKYDPFIIGSKYIIDLLELPFYDSEEEQKNRKKKTWLQRLFNKVPL